MLIATPLLIESSQDAFQQGCCILCNAVECMDYDSGNLAVQERHSLSDIVLAIVGHE